MNPPKDDCYHGTFPEDAQPRRIDEHRQRGALASSGDSGAAVRERAGLEEELEGLESRAFTISQRIHEIRRELNNPSSTPKL